MMPDLGKYAFAVLASYGATIVLIGALVALSFRQRARVKKTLDEVEARAAAQTGKNDG
ncbi:heme exporter protein CcmD [Xinfangfangia pollutisoli]|uniref:heme exporter protein CcmD n=1 Tax=Xinfangfangia pollutisoli TaxID=2865960 RepID=UPI001CD6D283|nr:heme exporter protein CcmD [Xinfangfangia pollutisoli]